MIHESQHLEINPRRPKEWTITLTGDRKVIERVLMMDAWANLCALSHHVRNRWWGRRELRRAGIARGQVVLEITRRFADHLYPMIYQGKVYVAGEEVL